MSPRPSWSPDPVYARLVTETLEPTDQRAYAVGTARLVAMREAVDAADESEQFETFLVGTAHRNRRRPACRALLREYGLLC